MNRLQSKIPSISNIRKTFDTPSVSCGVLHQGTVIFLHSEGHANVQRGQLANEDTVYSIASCSKGFVTALCNILAHEGKLAWTTPIHQYLPDFQTVHDVEVGKRATLLDLCSHSTGLAPMDRAGCGFFDEFYNKGTDQVHICANLPVCYDFRSRWLYNNFTMGVVGEAIQAVCGKSAGEVLKEKIFDPLGLIRTCTSVDGYPSDGNVATGYSILDNGQPLPHQDPALADGSVQGASGFVRSTVNDMLAWAKAIMEAESIGSCKEQSVAYEVLHGIEFTRCTRCPITSSGGLHENSYGLGWFRHMLPSMWLGSIGPNSALLEHPPIIGRSSRGRLAVCHYGAFGGFLSSFYTFPDSCSAVIVMANSSGARGDPTDLIAQMLIQELFQMKPEICLEQYARRAMDNSGKIWPSLVREWVINRTRDTVQRPLADFIGTYSNSDFLLTLEIFELPPDDRGTGPLPELLGFRVNSLEKQFSKLRHYHYDVWSLLPDSRDDAVRKGMECYLSLPMLLLYFLRDKNDSVYALDWNLQAGICEGPAPGLDEAVDPVRFWRCE